MKKGFLRLTLLFLGAFFFFSPCAARERVSAVAEYAAYQSREKFPKGVTIDGVCVGGMTRAAGLNAVRKRLEETTPVLEVQTAKTTYRFSAPEIGFSDDLDKLFVSCREKGVYRAAVRWYLKGKEEKIERIAADNGVKALNALVVFGSNGFSYLPERTGLACNTQKLSEDVERALQSPVQAGRFPTVFLQTERIMPDKTRKDAEKGTAPLASCTTYFNEEDGGRSANIRLAASFLDGLTVLSGQEVSFNAVVGERTKKRGFFEAKIIQEGKFVKGTGGGVCQVSTTLYNAAIESGLYITARSPHSLPVSYVEPSKDAMVSSRCDFRFKNPFPYPVYLSVKTGLGWIQARFYGKQTGREYKLVGVKTGELPPPEPSVEYGETEGELKAGRAGVLSEGYLETYQNGALVSRRLISRDRYAPTRGVVGKKREEKGE